MLIIDKIQLCFHAMAASTSKIPSNILNRRSYVGSTQITEWSAKLSERLAQQSFVKNSKVRVSRRSIVSVFTRHSENFANLSLDCIVKYIIYTCTLYMCAPADMLPLFISRECWTKCAEIMYVVIKASYSRPELYSNENKSKEQHWFEWLSSETQIAYRWT